jgi:hypothetical protein
MNFLTRATPWATWQIGVLKLSMIALGIILGVTFSEFWRPLLWPLGLVFAVTAIWSLAIWLTAVRRSP